MKTNRKIRIGIIGLGVGEKYLEGIVNSKSSNFECVAICDFDEKKLNEVVNRFSDQKQIRKYESADELLNQKDIDCVAIASFDSHHYLQTCKALDSDKHVFVEKPFCTQLEEAKEIRKRLNAKPHLKLSSNLILRKVPRFADLKSRVSGQEFGNLYYIEGDYNYGRIEKILKGWRGQEPYYSIVYGGGVHLVDLILWLNPEDPVVQVTALGNKIVTQGTSFKFNDFSVALLQFSSGRIATLDVFLLTSIDLKSMEPRRPL
jgi:predicted dehydrogenase